MSAESGPLPSLAGSAPGPIAAPSWRIALALIVAAILVVLGVYWTTAESIVAIWMRSETFAHGFLIVPVSVFLVYLKRRELATLQPTPDIIGFLMLALAGLGWLVATAGQVQVVAQYAMVAMIPAIVVAIAGRRVAWSLLFPLGFLFFAVPVGEALVPPLMNWTADFTVAALRLTGLPIYREGNFFTTPTGQWSVVEGCSGVRYLIASVTVGALYAYLNYRATWKRAVFVLASIIVPILANGLRAYLIVMIAHLSDMKLAMGVDHLIYGWVFFGVVMLILFWIGSYWRDSPADTDGTAVTPPARESVRPRFGLAAAGVVALALPWQLYALHLDRDRGGPAPVLARPAAVGGWEAVTNPMSDWRPSYAGASATAYQVYRKGDATVAVWMGFYPRQSREAQLVTSTNQMIVQKHRVWSNVGQGQRSEPLGGHAIQIRETRLRSAAQRLLVWDWYSISGRELTNPVLAKILFARDRLLAGSDKGTAVIVSTPYEGDPTRARETLRSFVSEMLPSIRASVADAERNGHASR
jgi:exosortase A